MNTRIRYVADETGNVLRSVKDFQHPDNGARYSVTLNKTNNTFFIRDEMGDALVTGGSGANLHQTKIAAKKALEKLGISFATEKREPKQTILSV